MKIMKKEIKTERLTLRPYSKKNRDSLVSILKNDEISKTFMIPEYKDESEYLGLADRIINNSKKEDTSHLEYEIFLGDTLIGFVNDCGFDDEKMRLTSYR